MVTKARSKNIVMVSVFTATLFVLVSILLNELARSEYDVGVMECGWKKLRITQGGVDYIHKYKRWCDLDLKGSCKGEKIGKAWLSMAALAFIVGAVSTTTAVLDRFAHFAYDIVAAVLCFIAVLAFYGAGKGCYDKKNDTWGDDVEMGKSGVLMIVAGLLFIACVIGRIGLNFTAKD